MALAFGNELRVSGDRFGSRLADRRPPTADRRKPKAESRNVPVVLSGGEIERVLAQMEGTYQLMAKLLYGRGMPDGGGAVAGQGPGF